MYLHLYCKSKCKDNVFTIVHMARPYLIWPSYQIWACQFSMRQIKPNLNLKVPIIGQFIGLSRPVI